MSSSSGSLDSEFLLATRNQGKFLELEEMLSGLSIRLKSLHDFPHLPDAVEDGKTFLENARKKALHFYRLTGLPAIADDSGLEVDALEGRPGVFSARYAPDDPSRIAKLLRELSELEAEQGESVDRTARFVCAISVCMGREERIEVEGEVRGEIARSPRGEHGFGYDPIFFVRSEGKTFAEMSRREKNRISHRGRALEKLRESFSRYFE